ncbi:MAG: single-stranded DNA-binding protein [Methanosarcina mazei]|jgi:single-strand DNA-binding protein|nr:single-stranded DNA-binding protein [Methanosarcina mazei]
MYNKVILAGNLTRDIELRYSQGGMGIAKTAIATSRKFTNNGEKKEEVCYSDIVFFGRSAEVANQYLRKGSKILVEGRLHFEQWVDQNGQKRSKHSVVVETMQMLDSKGDAPNGYNAPQVDNDYDAPQVDNDYDAPQYVQEQSHQPQSYQQSSYSAPQQQSYQQQGYQPQQQPMQNRQMPQSNSIPVIDVDEDIPF